MMVNGIKYDTYKSDAICHSDETEDSFDELYEDVRNKVYKGNNLDILEAEIDDLTKMTIAEFEIVYEMIMDEKFRESIKRECGGNPNSKNLSRFAYKSANGKWCGLKNPAYPDDSTKDIVINIEQDWDEHKRVMEEARILYEKCKTLTVT